MNKENTGYKLLQQPEEISGHAIIK